MSEQNKEIIRRFEAAFAANDGPVIDELCDPGLVDHNPVPGFEPNLTGFKQAVDLYHSAFPGYENDLHAVIGDGDMVATLWTVTGTHKGELFGIAPSGKTVTVEGMNFYRLANGKVTEVWTQFDSLAMLQQLGAIPEG